MANKSSLDSLSFLPAKLELKILTCEKLTEAEDLYLSEIKTDSVFICSCNGLNLKLVLKKRNSFFFSHLTGSPSGHALRCPHYGIVREGNDKALDSINELDLIHSFLDAANFTVFFSNQSSYTKAFSRENVFAKILQQIPALKGRIYYGYKELRLALRSEATKIWFSFIKKDLKTNQYGPFLSLKIIKNKKISSSYQFLLVGQGVNFLVFNAKQRKIAREVFKHLTSGQRLLSQYHNEARSRGIPSLLIKVKGRRETHCLIVTEDDLLFERISNKYRESSIAIAHQIKKIDDIHQTLLKIGDDK